MPPRLQISFAEWEARYLIEALKVLEAKWEEHIDSSNDEDEQADYGNDLVFLSEMKDRVTDAAKSVYGETVARISRKLL